MSGHKRFTVATTCRIICDPRSPWQRGSNENTNGSAATVTSRGNRSLGFSQTYLNSIALRLSQHTRKTLGLRNPCR